MLPPKFQYKILDRTSDFTRKLKVAFTDNVVCFQDIYSYGETVFPGLPYYLKLEELRQRAEWKDCCSWLLTNGEVRRFMRSQYKNVTDMTAFLKNLHNPQRQLFASNITADGYASRRNSAVTNMHYDMRSTFCMLNVPFKDGDWDDMFFSVWLYKGDTLEIHHKEAVEVTDENYVQHLVDVCPTFECTLPEVVDADNIIFGSISATYDREPLPYPVTIYLESDAGYLPKTKYTIFKEPVNFKLCTTALESGDEITVKVGTRFRANLAHVTTKVK